jgi:hypothetical protein
VQRSFKQDGKDITKIHARNGENAIRAVANTFLPDRWKGEMAALSEKALAFETVDVGPRQGRSVTIGR